MKIELLIDGEEKTFTAPFIPMMANRKWNEILAEAEKRGDEKPTAEELLKEDEEVASILTDIIFKGQFTLDELYNGASKEYIDEKLSEALFNSKKKQPKDEEGNKEGK